MSGPVPVEMLLRYAVVVAAWLGVVAQVAGRVRRREAAAARIRRTSWVGLSLQCAAFLLPLTAPRGGAEPGYVGAAIVVLALSVHLFRVSARALGRQWSLVARVRGAHELVTHGPYGVLRHPIYAATAGMVLGTGLAVGRPAACTVAAALYLAGTAARVRSEETVLRETFGRRFDAYARTVPRWIPRVGPWLRARARLGPDHGGSE